MSLRGNHFYTAVTSQRVVSPPDNHAATSRPIGDRTTSSAPDERTVATSPSVVVRCERPSGFPDDAFRDEYDWFRNAIVLPPYVFRELGVDPFCYLEAIPNEEPYDWGAAVVVFAVAFEETMDRDRTARLGHEAVIRTNLMNEISPLLEVDNEIRLRPVADRPTDELRAMRSYADQFSGEVCYVHPDVRSDIGVDVGATVEAHHTVTGGRHHLELRELRSDRESTDVVRIDGHSRRVLDVELGETVRLRKPKDVEPTRRGFETRLLDGLVGRRAVSLRVLPGLDRDEYRNIARINADTMRFLGIESGDIVTIEWKGRTATIRCMDPPEGTSVPPLSILLPSTERDRIDVSIYDACTVYRDVGYVFRKHLSLSTLGVLVVLLGAVQVVDVGAAIEGVSSAGELVALTVVAVLTVAAVALATVWLMLYPERQRCAQFD